MGLLCNLAIKREMYVMIICVSIVVVLFFMTGCSCENNEIGNSDSQTNSSQSTDYANNSAMGNNQMGDTESNINASHPKNKGEAIKNDRESGTYSYDGWGIMAPAPDVYFLTNKIWIGKVNEDFNNKVSSSLYYNSWANPEQGESEIIWRTALDGITSPADEVKAQVDQIVAEGEDVEYGEYKSPYMYGGYYYHRLTPSKENAGKAENWDIQIYYSNGGNGFSLTYSSLSLKLTENSTSQNDAITEDNFWKMASSYYLGGPTALPNDYYNKLTGKELEVFQWQN